MDLPVVFSDIVLTFLNFFEGVERVSVMRRGHCCTRASCLGVELQHSREETSTASSGAKGYATTLDTSRFWLIPFLLVIVYAFLTFDVSCSPCEDFPPDQTCPRYPRSKTNLGAEDITPGIQSRCKVHLFWHGYGLGCLAESALRLSIPLRSFSHLTEAESIRILSFGFSWL